MSWNEKMEARAEALLAGAPPAFATLERELLAAALPELKGLRLELEAATRELAAAQRAAADLAEALTYDSKPRRPDSLSYGMSCRQASPAPADATAGGGQ